MVPPDRRRIASQYTPRTTVSASVNSSTVTIPRPSGNPDPDPGSRTSPAEELHFFPLIDRALRPSSSCVGPLPDVGGGFPRGLAARGREGEIRDRVWFRVAMSRRSLRARAEVNYDTHDQNMGSKTPAWLKVRVRGIRMGRGKDRRTADRPTPRHACCVVFDGGMGRRRARNGSRRHRNGSLVPLGRRKLRLKR